ncbi:MAG: ABC transporter permease [Saprospiraceae bacterium]
MNSLKLSWKNLIHKPLSMLLSLVLFALGVGLISMLLLLDKQVQDKFDKNLAGIDLVIGAKGSPLQLILSSMYHIDSPTGNISIKEARPFMNPKHPLIKSAIPLSIGDSHKGYRIIGTIHEYVDSLYRVNIGTGKLWMEDLEVTIGATVARELNLSIGSNFHSAHGLGTDEIMMHDDVDAFKVVGIFAESGTVVDQLILTNPQSIWKVHDHDHGKAEGGHDHEGHDHEGHDHEGHDHEGHDHEGHDHEGHDHEGHDHGHEHTTATPKKALTDEVDKEITSLLVKYRNNRDWRSLNLARNIDENTDLKAANPAYEINHLYSMMGVGTEALTTLAWIIVFVSGLSIFISLFSSLKERRYELALLRVMGASRFKVFSLIILEGLILAILGYLIGLGLSHLGMELLADHLKAAYQYNFTGKIFLQKELYLLAGALFIGFVAAVIPAIQASRTDISKTLTES